MNPTIEVLSAACWSDPVARYALADYLMENQLENNGSYGGSYGSGGIGSGSGGYGYGDSSGGGSGGSGSGSGGSGSGSGGYGYGDGSGGGSGGSGGGSGGSDIDLLLQVAIMFEIGQIVLVHLGGAYDPLAVCGTVVRLIGVEGAELGPDAVAVHRCSDGRWADLAAGDMSLATRVIPAPNIRFPRCRNAWTAKQIPEATMA